MAYGNQVQIKESTAKEFSVFMTGEAVKQRVNEILGGAGGQKFVTSIIAAVNTNPELAKCEKSTIFAAALQGQSLNLSPSPHLGHYYMVPYKNRKKGIVEAQFQLGYKGYLQLAMRSGQYLKLNPFIVKACEFKSWNPITEELEVELMADALKREHSDTAGYGFYMKLINGFEKTFYWPYKKMLSHADRYSFAFDSDNYKNLKAGKIPQKELWKYSSFWYKEFDDMALKTMIRHALGKFGILSIDMINAYESDMAVLENDGKRRYVDFDQAEIETAEEKKQLAGSQVVDADFAEQEDASEQEPAEIITPEEMADWAQEEI